MTEYSTEILFIVMVFSILLPVLVSDRESGHPATWLALVIYCLVAILIEIPDLPVGLTVAYLTIGLLKYVWWKQTDKRHMVMTGVMYTIVAVGFAWVMVTEVAVLKPIREDVGKAVLFSICMALVYLIVLWRAYTVATENKNGVVDDELELTILVLGCVEFIYIYAIGVK